MMLALVLIAVIATDIAVAIMFVAMRRALLAPAAPVESASAEVDELLTELRSQAEQASVEIGRQKAQLRRMLADVEHGQATQPVSLIPLAGVGPALTRHDVLRLSAEGYSLRQIAGDAGVSVEEVRLMLRQPAGAYATA